MGQRKKRQFPRSRGMSNNHHHATKHFMSRKLSSCNGVVFVTPITPPWGLPVILTPMTIEHYQVRIEISLKNALNAGTAGKKTLRTSKAASCLWFTHEVCRSSHRETFFLCKRHSSCVNETSDTGKAANPLPSWGWRSTSMENTIKNIEKELESWWISGDANKTIRHEMST